MNKFVKATFKRYLPLIIVMTIIVFVTTLVATSFIPDIYIERYYPNNGSTQNYFSEGIAGIIIFLIYTSIPALIISGIAPFIANDYRYSPKAADLYNQVACDKKKIRYTLNLFFIIVIASILFVSYLSNFIFVAIVQFSALSRGIIVKEYSDYIQTTSAFPINLGYLALSFLLIIFLSICNYFFSYFFVTRSNCRRNSVLMLFCGYLIMSLGFITPFQFVTTLRNVDTFYNFYYLPVTRGITMVNMIAIMVSLFPNLIAGGSIDHLLITNATDNKIIFSSVLTIICVVLFLAFVAFSIYLFINEKETSGEFNDKPSGRGGYQTALFHVGFTLICFMNIAIRGILVLSVLTLIVSSAIYYVFLGVLRHNFKLDKNNLIIFLSSITFNLIMVIINYSNIFPVL